LLLKRGREELAHHARRERVGDRSFETVADLDAHLPLLREDEEDQTVVVLFLADAPLPRAADREVLGGLTFERRERVDVHLAECVATAAPERRSMEPEEGDR